MTYSSDVLCYLLITEDITRARMSKIVQMGFGLGFGFAAFWACKLHNFAQLRKYREQSAR